MSWKAVREYAVTALPGPPAGYAEVGRLKTQYLALVGRPAAGPDASNPGWLRKEGKKNQFKRRWIVLWRHPQAKHSNDFMLIHYEAPEALQPDGILILSPGKYHIGPPKSARKGYPLCFRVDGTRCAGTPRPTLPHSTHMGASV